MPHSRRQIDFGDGETGSLPLHYPVNNLLNREIGKYHYSPSNPTPAEIQRIINRLRILRNFDVAADRDWLEYLRRLGDSKKE